jgi:hypothetical protein
MGPHKASKSPPSVSWLRRKEKVRGLYALPPELFKKKALCRLKRKTTMLFGALVVVSHLLRKIYHSII